MKQKCAGRIRNHNRRPPTILDAKPSSDNNNNNSHNNNMFACQRKQCQRPCVNMPCNFFVDTFFLYFFNFLVFLFQGAAVRENCFKIYKQLRAIPKIALLFEH